jgi:hypothetical protein
MPRLLIAIAIAVATVAPHARADELQFLFGQKPKPLVDPAGYFRVLLPGGFDCEAGPRKVNCRGNRGVQSSLMMAVYDVPTSATVELVFLNESEKFGKKPHYKLLSKKKQKLDGTPALLATYTYDFNGNVEYPVLVHAFYMVRGSKQYLIQFEGRKDQFAEHSEDLKNLYATFKAARVDGGGHPIIEDLQLKDLKAPQQTPTSLKDVDDPGL